MAPSIECPPADVLRDLLLGLGDDASAKRLEQHVETCPSCAERARRLPKDDELVRTVHRVGSMADTPIPELAETLASVFRRLKGGGSEATRSWAAPATADPQAFLAPAAKPNEIGSIGPFSIQEVLGAGGMGVVYRGYDPRLDRAVAIKVVRPELVAAKGMVDRFLAEARAAAAVEHDHIVVVHAVEIHDGIPCLVMPLLKGETLEQRLKDATGPRSTEEVLRIGKQVASGLAAAHGRGLVHRDIKPGNLWIEDPNGRIKILDFGLAMVSDGSGAACGFAGTPGYAAPEQIRNQGIDSRADLYSLGCVLYRMATGKPVFPAESPISVLVHTLTRTPMPTGTANAKLHSGLARLIDGLLKKAADERPATAEIVLAQLEAIEREFVRRRTRITRRRWFAAVAVAGLVGAAGVWFAQPDPVPQTPPEPPVKIEFQAESDLEKVVLSRDGEEFLVDLGTDAKASLVPGDYAIRTAAGIEGREVVPNSLIVIAGEPRMVKLALVGQAAVFNEHTQPVRGIATIPQKDRFAVLSTGLDRTLNHWLPGSNENATRVNLTSPAQCLASSADGSLVATAGGNKQEPLELNIHLWDGRTLQPKGEPLNGHTRKLFALALSADGKSLLSATVDELWLWNVADREHKKLEGQSDKVLCAAFDPAGKRLLTGDEKGYVVLWDIAETKLLRKVFAQSLGTSGAVRAVAFTAAGFLTAGDDGFVRVWDGTTFKPRDLPVGKKPIFCLALAKDGKRFLVGDDAGTIKLWSLPEGVEVYKFSGLGKTVRGVVFSPDGRNALSCGDDRTVRVWRLPFE